MKRLEPEVEREVRRLAAKGHKLREIGRMLGCSRHAVTNTLRRQPHPPSVPEGWSAANCGCHAGASWLIAAQ
jgi:DNA invertase Pin-like site-specific DNA recombinase